VAAWGYYADPDTGLLYLRARYYSPSIGRFVSLDSYLGQASDPMSLHRYLYCGNGPLIYVDPTGHFDLSGDVSWEGWMWWGIGAALAAVGFYFLYRANTYGKGGTIVNGTIAIAAFEASITLFALSLVGISNAFIQKGCYNIRRRNEPWCLDRC
jgi:RHS repeat-associated protein